jgi:rhomboid protease GluP
MWGLTSVLSNLGRELPFDNVVVGGCIFLYLAMIGVMMVDDPESIHIMEGGIFNILPPGNEALLRFGAAGAFPVFLFDRWWTLLSAGWLHANLLHIAFNVYWIRLLAPATSELYGASRMIVIYTISTIVGFLFSSGVGAYVLLGKHLTWLEGLRLGGSGLTVGASAPILGLLGAAVCYGHRTGAYSASRQAWSYALFMIVFGFLMSRVDNWAHIGGFLGGYLAGLLLRPERKESPTDTALAILCLVATAASIVASLVDVRFYRLL